MKFLLDENFPLQLLRRLREEGHAADHIIELDLRGISDERIRSELLRPRVALVTQDVEFVARPVPEGVVVVLSRVPQELP